MSSITKIIIKTIVKLIYLSTQQQFGIIFVNSDYSKKQVNNKNNLHIKQRQVFRLAKHKKKMNNKYPNNLDNIIKYAREEAANSSNSFIRPEHMLLAVIREGNNRACEIFKILNINIEKLKKDIRFFIVREGLYSNDISNIALSIESDRILRLADLEAKLLQENKTEIEHLVLALLKDKNNVAANALEMNGVTYNAFFEYCKKATMLTERAIDMSKEEELEGDVFKNDKELEDETFGKVNQKGKEKESPTPALDKFGFDMTKAASEGKLDPVVGRVNEIERLAQILCRRKKNNPILIGEPGVGKSAVVEGLASRIVEKKVSSILLDKRIVMLNMTNIVAGTKYRGQFEERITTIINEVKKNSNIILFIDEIHTIVGAGGAEDSMDAANILKPALARGELQCIGATTTDEYRKKIEKDGALERRFQKIMIDPTTTEETLQILNNIKDKYEAHHNVRYSNEAIRQCVMLADRYITDRQFPDKAIDVLDEAGSRCRLNSYVVPEEMIEAEKELEETRKLMTKALQAQDFELAAQHREKEKEIKVKIENIKNSYDSQTESKPSSIDSEDIANTVSMISGVPVSKMAEAEGMKLASMKKKLKGKVIGQDEAIEKVVKSILRSRVGLKDPNKPIGTFLFLGPTGVGKTHFAKELAKYMFGSTDSMIRIDMSEYMEKFTVSRLVGAPPGYVGYEEGGQLTEKIRRKPYSIVLLDEIEKAHGDVFNILLQLMDEGRLTDSYGKTVDCKNTIVIMTSNVGTKQLKEFGKGIGFGISNFDITNKEHSKSIIEKALNKTFSPEFLNRIDDIVTFDQLSKESIRQIIELELKRLYERVENIGYKISIEEKAIDFIAEKGYDVQYGARPLKRAIQRYLEDEISELIISNEENGTTINVSYKEKDDKLTIKFT